MKEMRVWLTRHAEQRLRERFHCKGDPIAITRDLLEEAEFVGRASSNGTLLYRHPLAWLVVAKRGGDFVLVTAMPSSWPIRYDEITPGHVTARRDASGADLERLAAVLQSQGVRVHRFSRPVLAVRLAAGQA